MVVERVGGIAASSEEEAATRLNQLVDDYFLRLSQLPPLSPELEYDSEDL